MTIKHTFIGKTLWVEFDKEILLAIDVDSEEIISAFKTYSTPSITCKGKFDGFSIKIMADGTVYTVTLKQNYGVNFDA